MKYLIRFVGRTRGAIGIFYVIEAEREASTEHDAVIALYDMYEHVQLPVIVAEDGVPVPNGGRMAKR